MFALDSGSSRHLTVHGCLVPSMLPLKNWTRLFREIRSCLLLPVARGRVSSLWVRDVVSDAALFWVVRVCLAAIAASLVMIVAATVGMIVAPSAHGMPVALTGFLSFGLTFVAVLVAIRNIEP